MRQTGSTGRGRRSIARMCGRLGGEKTGPSPVDRSRSGSKHHLIACGGGTPLAVSLTGGNRNDITQMIPLVDAIPPVRGRRGRPRRRPRSLYGDRAYHSREGRRELRRRRIQAKIAWPKSDHGRARDETLGHEAFLAIGCSLICFKLLQGKGVILVDL
jgi:hypothetical protein